MAMKPFSKEQLNFFRFSTLVLDEFPKVLRQLFIIMWDSKVSMKPGFIPWDDSITVRNLLLTSEGKTDIPTGKSIEEWDCTALFKATIYAKTFGAPSSKGSTLNDLYLKKVKPAPGSFHSSVQSATGNKDETFALVIDQLRLLRNTFCHSADAEITKADFDHYVKLVQNALTAVKLDTSFVDVIGKMNEDDFPTEKVQEFQECRIKELQSNSKFQESILSSIEQQTEKIEKIENMEKKLLEKVESLGNKAVSDTLPKSHIPRRDAMFTGREDEIKEVTNLVTDESTRIINIWGSPGFGKTSTAVEVAHHLDGSLGYRVYFFKLHCINTVDKFLSKILSIFKSNVVDPTILHLDKVIGIFREISAPVVLVFDNIDDLLSGGTSCTDFRNLLDEFSESNDFIKILFTTRGLLQTTRGQVEGFREFRIRSLSLASSLKFVRQLLPSFSECVVDRVVRISFHVPLAIKIVASSLVENSEDLANEILDEFNFSESLLEQIDDHAFGEEKMKTIFESLFERLALSEKKAFIILTAFASAMISKDAAVDIISKEMGSKSKAVHSLNSLVKKAFVDKDVKTEYFSVHPLIYSFAINVAKHRDFEDVLSSSRMHFCEYYLHVFERLNDNFLAGKSIDSPQLEDTIQHLQNAILQSLTYGYENSTNVSRILSAVCGILSKSETFLFSMIIPGSAFDEIPKIYDLAIEKSETNSLSYLKLHVSKYFQNIAFSFFVKCEHAVDIPKSIRENINLLSDGTAAKLSCYQAIFDISSGYVERGVVLIEKCLSGLQKYPDQLLLKCMCLQILMIYNRISNQVERSLEFREMAFDACAEIGNPNLFLTDDCDHKADEVGESLILFNYLFFIWSKEFLPAEVKRHLCHSVYKIQQQKEAKVCCSPDYFNSIILYGDYLVTFLSDKPEQDVILNKRIQGLIDVKGDAASDMSQQNTKMRAYLSGRLLFSHDLKIAITNDKEQNIEACRNALDSSIQHFGERHQRTAKCYYNIGLAQYNLENYTSALDSFDHALNILLGMSQEPDVFNILSDLYLEKGKTCEGLGDFEQAFLCYEEALTLQKSNTDNEESEKIAAILFSKGSLQYGRRDFTAALATLKHALRIRVNLFSEKRCSYMDLVSSYLSVGNSYYFMGDNTERESYFENALKILKSSIDGKYESEKFIIEKCVVYMQILHWKVDPNLSTEFLDRCIPLVKKHASCLLPILYMTVGFNQLESRKTKAGLTFIQNALDLGLDPIQQAHALIRGMTVYSYSKVVLPTIIMKEYKLAKKIIDRALHIAESVPEPEKPRVMLNCYFLRGCFYTNTQNYSSAIKSLRTALLHLSEDSSDSECAIRWNIAIAHDCQGSYKDALHELFFIIKNGLVEGSEKEGDTYCLIANISRKLKKSSLVAQNLQLAYNMYLKVLGKDHPKTRQCLVALLFDEQFSQYLHGEFAPG